MSEGQSPEKFSPEDTMNKVAENIKGMEGLFQINKRHPNDKEFNQIMDDTFHS